MTINLDSEILKKLLIQASLRLNGDKNEKKYEHYLSKQFPNCEKFWQLFIVPLTRRIDGYPGDLISDIKFRHSVKPELTNIASAHYSMFMNLVYAHLHLEMRKPFSVEGIYIHLGSACDLAESVLVKWHLLQLTCRGEESDILQKLSRSDFLKIAGEWYDGRYKKLYKYYQSKGKPLPLILPPRKNLLTEYLGDCKYRKDYARLSQTIREFRNVIVHDVQIGRIVIRKGKMLTPKPEFIQKYRSWSDVCAVTNNEDLIKNHFTEPYRQARKDIEDLEILINRLWDTMVKEFTKEFYSEERNILLKMFKIEFSSDGLTDTTTQNVVDIIPEVSVSGSAKYTGETDDIDPDIDDC